GQAACTGKGPWRPRRSGAGGATGTARRGGGAGRGRSPDRARAKGLARGSLAAPESRHPATRLRPRLPAQSRASRSLHRAQWRRRGHRSSAEASGRLDGVMMGRAAYQDPWRLLAVDPVLVGEAAPFASPKAAAEALIPYIEGELARGTRLNAVTRHVLGLFRGVPGARSFRRHLATEASKPAAGAAAFREALALVVDMDAQMVHSAAA